TRRLYHAPTVLVGTRSPSAPCVLAAVVRDLPEGAFMSSPPPRHLLAALMLISALTGCAQPPRSESSVHSGTAAREDELPRLIGVIGGRTQHAPPFLGVPGANYYCLR